MRDKLKILVVEDDIYFVQELQQNLEEFIAAVYPNLDFSIVTSTNAQDFLEKLDKDMDVVVMDYYLENDFGEVLFPGTYLIRAINLYCKECKVIVMSAIPDKLMASKLIRSGIYDYITKGEHVFFRLALTLDKIVKRKLQKAAA
ncbi:response regulator [Fulvivirga sp.]|uniref:response regulator n=1 Tax=Fulvivirga sp. TaxID=1931237 RepID=UPI0032F0880E